MKTVSADHAARRVGHRLGFSLTELLVASTIALTLMGAVAQLFSLFGRTMRETQSTVDLAARLRVASWRLEQDLNGVTAKAAPWNEPSTNSGYIEIIEGPHRDADSSTTSSIAGDTDDALLLTTQSEGSPFVGRMTNGGTVVQVESPVAEVAWFCRVSGTVPGTGLNLHNLHRRQLLVMGYVGAEPFNTTATNTGTSNTIPDASPFPSPDYDISLRKVTLPGITGYYLMPNTLADLTKRENRFIRSGTTSFPHAFPYESTGASAGRPIQAATFEGTSRASEDVILPNVIGFDLRVFDPGCRVMNDAASGITLIPGDSGYTSLTATGTSLGAYVDMGWRVSGSAAGVYFPGQPYPTTALAASGVTAFGLSGLRLAASATNNAIALTLSPTNSLLVNATYDTWSRHYEFNGIDDDKDGIVDEGADGLDNNMDGISDNVSEYETSPPYPVPLKGVEVRIRCYDPATRQVRQVSIRTTFTNR
jgi:hypothetical protein